MRDLIVETGLMIVRLPRASKDESRASVRFLSTGFSSIAARIGDVHRGDLVARFMAVEETFAACGRARKRSSARKARYEAIRKPKICVVVLSDGYRE
jgi:hypothetical protein